MSLRAVKRLLRPQYRKGCQPSGTTVHPEAAIPNVAADSPSTCNIVPSPHTKGHFGAKPSVRALTRLNSLVPSKVTSARLKKLAHAILAFWGLVIILLHVRVSFESVPLHCIAMVRTWFATKSGCALMYVNCKTINGATGNLAELTITMDNMNENTLLHVVIRHCPHVEIPSRLQAFPT